MKRIISLLPFLLLTLMLLILVAATFVEHFYGSKVAYQHVYHTTLFRTLWAAIVAIALPLVVRRKLWKRPSAFLLHVAFVVVLLGAFATATTSVTGNLHLRKGEATSIFQTDDKTAQELPFDLLLTDFRMLYYEGTESVRDYESHLNIAGDEEVVVSMNRIYERAGYRFYQSSYDSDGAGSVLMVNYDPYGTPLTYAGYLLLVFAMLAQLLEKRGGFRRWMRHPALRRSALLLVGVTLSAHASRAATQTPQQVQVVARTQADALAERPVVYGGRICPLNTLATDFCKKIYGKRRFRHLSPEQVLGSWLVYPDQWQRVAMIRIKHEGLRQRLGIEGDYAQLLQLYSGNHYRLLDIMQEESDHNSPLARAVQEVDEKVALILMLHKGTLIKRAPETAARSIPQWRFHLELLYNRFDWVSVAFMAQLTLGILAFVAMVVRPRWKWLTPTLRGLLWVALTLVSSLFVARWIIGGYVPLSNGFETMLFLSLCVLGVGVTLSHRFSFVLPFSFLLSGFSLLVAHLSDMNPQITPLMPVLASPLLSLHVTIVMLSYALFALMAFNSGYALWLLRKTTEAPRAEQLTVLNRVLLYPAVFLLTAGIFVGAVWANVSWGRYWGWDPKEVWALITMLLYSFALHSESLPLFRRPRAFHLFLLLAFLSVVMTYFGVNYLLGGRHAYA